MDDSLTSPTVFEGLVIEFCFATFVFVLTKRVAENVKLLCCQFTLSLAFAHERCKFRRRYRKRKIIKVTRSFAFRRSIADAILRSRIE